MGKGDKKTKRGKIIMGSYGVSRQRKKEQHSPENNASEAKATKQKDKKPK